MLEKRRIIQRFDWKRDIKGVRDFWRQEQVRNEDYSIKKEKNCGKCSERSQPLLQYCNVFSNCEIGTLQDHGPHTPIQDEGSSPMMDVAKG